MTREYTRTHRVLLVGEVGACGFVFLFIATPLLGERREETAHLGARVPNVRVGDATRLFVFSDADEALRLREYEGGKEGARTMRRRRAASPAPRRHTRTAMARLRR